MALPICTGDRTFHHEYGSPQFRTVEGEHDAGP